MSEFVLDAQKDEKTAPDIDAASLGDNTWRLTGCLKETMRHEVYHAIDAMVERVTGTRLSSSAAYIKAYETDRENLLVRDPHNAQKYMYFIRDHQPERGRKEAFAELGAEVAGGSMRGKSMAQDFPLTYAYIHQTTHQLDASFSKSLAQGMACLNEMRLQENPSLRGVEPSVDVVGAGIWTDLLRNDPRCQEEEVVAWARAIGPKETQAWQKRLEETKEAFRGVNDAVILKTINAQGWTVSSAPLPDAPSPIPAALVVEKGLGGEQKEPVARRTRHYAGLKATAESQPKEQTPVIEKYQSHDSDVKAVPPRKSFGRIIYTTGLKP